VHLKHNKQRTKYKLTKSYNLISLPILLTFQNANRAYLATAICFVTSNATATSYCQSINDPHFKFVSRMQKTDTTATGNSALPATAISYSQTKSDFNGTFKTFSRLLHRRMLRTRLQHWCILYTDYSRF